LLVLFLLLKIYIDVWYFYLVIEHHILWEENIKSQFYVSIRTLLFYHLYKVVDKYILIISFLFFLSVLILSSSESEKVSLINKSEDESPIGLLLDSLHSNKK
jgi:hypothetical protein